MKRRQLLLGTGALAAGAWLSGTRQDRGGAHSTYFLALTRALDRVGLARPTLIVDRQRLHANIDLLRAQIGDRYAYRVVAKSLPSVNLLQAVCQRADTRRLMVFHQPFVNQIARDLPQADLLLGKPMPVAAAARCYQHFAPGPFAPEHQLQWLIDTPRRAQQYGELAQQRGLMMRINLELDVGLHRGGLSTAQDLRDTLRIIAQHPQLTLSGFMGYEPHVTKMPTLLGGANLAFNQAQQRYRDLLTMAENFLQRDLQTLTLNGAGSTTYARYDGTQAANELAAGSALVKPSDFDLPLLSAYRPAAFIATPVLKALPTAQVPGIEALSGLSAALSPNHAHAFFIYGGYWKAEPVSPPGLRTNPLFGRSSNQEMLNGSASVTLAADDWVFLRPTQSEHVFLQFGDIAVYDNGEITEFWPVFSASESS